jgi:acetyltransferase-like isoleucine patch superfamily enzyme
LYEGAEIKNDVQVFERSLIGSCSLVGHKSRLLYGAQVHDNVIIGASTIVGGFIADNCIIGNKCIIYGSLIHKHSNKDTSKWDDIDEIGPTVEDNVFIGWGAIIIGDVKVGKGAVIKANAVVTKDIAPGARYG